MPKENEVTSFGRLFRFLCRIKPSSFLLRALVSLMFDHYSLNIIWLDCDHRARCDKDRGSVCERICVCVCVCVCVRRSASGLIHLISCNRPQAGGISLFFDLLLVSPYLLSSPSTFFLFSVWKWISLLLPLTQTELRLQEYPRLIALFETHAAGLCQYSGVMRGGVQSLGWLKIDSSPLWDPTPTSTFLQPLSSLAPPFLYLVLVAHNPFIGHESKWSVKESGA